MLAPVRAGFFAALFALYAGLALVVITGLILAPVFHRVLHGLHVPDEDPPTPKPRVRKPR